MECYICKKEVNIEDIKPQIIKDERGGRKKKIKEARFIYVGNGIYRCRKHSMIIIRNLLKKHGINLKVD